MIIFFKYILGWTTRYRGWAESLLETGTLVAVPPFSKLNEIFFGYFDPDFFLKIIKINNFRVELTDNSA